MHHLTQRSQSSNYNYILTGYAYHWCGEEVVWFLVLFITGEEDHDTPNEIAKDWYAKHPLKLPLSLKLHWQHLSLTIVQWNIGIVIHSITTIYLCYQNLIPMKSTHKFLNLNRFSPKSSYSPWGFPSHFGFMVFKWLLSIVIQWLPITCTIKSQCITIAFKSLYYLAPIDLSNSITLCGLPSLGFNHTRIHKYAKRLRIFLLMF